MYCYKYIYAEVPVYIMYIIVIYVRICQRVERRAPYTRTWCTRGMEFVTIASNMEVKHMMRNEKRLDALIHAMARTVSQIALFERCDGGKDTFVGLMKDQIAHMPTKTTRRDLVEFVKHQNFANECFILSKMIYNKAVGATDNVDLRPYARYSPYYIKVHSKVDTAREVGGIGECIMKSVCSLSYSWVRQIDDIICNAMGISYYSSTQEQDAMEDTCCYLSEGIARMATMMQQEGGREMLSSNMMEIHLNQMLNRHTPPAIEQIHRDRQNIHLFIAVCNTHLSSKCIPDWVDRRTDIVKCIKNMPEIFSVILMEYRKEVNVEMLYDALLMEDINVSMMMCKMWCRLHGETALHVANTALQNISILEDDIKTSRFKKIILDEESYKHMRRVAHKARIPEMQHVVTSKAYFLNLNSIKWRFKQKRSAVYSTWYRIMYLTCAVWELSAFGYIEKGVVHRDLLISSSLMSMMFSGICHKRLQLAVEDLYRGFELSSMIVDMVSNEGYLSGEMSRALCELSMFSVREIASIFNSSGPAMKTICKRFSQCALSKIFVKKSDMFMSFASDAVPVVVAALHSRRTSICVSKHHPTSAAMDILRTIPKIRSAEPFQRYITVGIEDLSQAHSTTRQLLKSLSDNGIVARIDRNGEHKKLAYTIDMFTLRMLNLDEQLGLAEVVQPT